jgi:hypothetical protein
MDVKQGKLAVELAGVRNLTVAGTDEAADIDSETKVVTPEPDGRAEAELGRPTTKRGESARETAATGRQGKPTLPPLSTTKENYVSVVQV